MSSSCTSGSRRMSRAAEDTSLPRRLPGCAARLHNESRVPRGQSTGAVKLLGRQLQRGHTSMHLGQPCELSRCPATQPHPPQDRSPPTHLNATTFSAQ